MKRKDWMQSDAEVRSQVRRVLGRFNDLVSTKDPQVLAEFAASDDVLLLGSEAGEVATGRTELRASFSRIFARDATFSWEWNRIDTSHEGNIAWFFADGHVVPSTAKRDQATPCRITRVLQRQGERWLWRQYHGSEPVNSE
jgi:ketosteroid isomerase-like protein